MGYTQEERLEIASTILSQLGGNRFRTMTGAREMIALESGLQFALPGRLAKDGINRVKIHLTPRDTYKVEYFKTWGTSAQIVTVDEEVYADGLINSFQQATGLSASL
jgi:hypothetical protein